MATMKVKLCDFGCGKEAIYQFKNGKWCCSKNISGCFGIKKRKKQTFLKKYGVDNPGKAEVIKEKIKQIWLEKYRVNHPFKVDVIIEKKKQTFLKKYGVDNPGKAEVIKEKIRQSWLDNIGVENIGQLNKLTISKIKKKYPTFYKEEKPRYNPNKPGEKEIQVHCKYSECENSKEKSGWFTPTRIQISERIRQLENFDGNDGSYFYCSEKCKSKCDLYNVHSDPYKNVEVTYTQEEYNIFRNEVLRRQKEEHGYNFCEYCYTEKKLHVHHEKPQKTNPLFVLDPDNGIVFCRECHYIYGHRTGTECSTGKLANEC